MTGERDEGQAATELALVLPLVAALLLFVVQVTLVARDQILVVHAARAAAREAAVDPRPASVRAAALDATGLKARRLRTEGVSRGAAPGVVTVQVQYRSATEVVVVGSLFPDVVLRAKAAMRSELGHVSKKTF